jgi:hypothetical protein
MGTPIYDKMVAERSAKKAAASKPAPKAKPVTKKAAAAAKPAPKAKPLKAKKSPGSY